MAITSNTSQRCRARRADGQPCRAWAVPGSPEALCHAPGGRKPADAPGAGSFNAEELQEMARFIEDQDFNLKDQIALNRLLQNRVMSYLDQDRELTPVEVATLAKITVTISRNVTRMACELQALQEKKKGQDDDGIPSWMARALDSLGKEWNLDL